jgi:hypothetical protein
MFDERHSIESRLFRRLPQEWRCIGLGDCIPSRGDVHQTASIYDDLGCRQRRHGTSRVDWMVKKVDAACFASLRSLPGALHAAILFVAPGIISLHPCSVSVVSKPPTTARWAQPGHRRGLVASVIAGRTS